MNFKGERNRSKSTGVPPAPRFYAVPLAHPNALLNPLHDLQVEWQAQTGLAIATLALGFPQTPSSPTEAQVHLSQEHPRV